MVDRRKQDCPWWIGENGITHDTQEKAGLSMVDRRKQDCPW